jgi:GTPase SAR1 family protein
MADDRRKSRGKRPKTGKPKSGAKPSRGASLPTLTRQKANENESRPRFELAIKPWLFQDSRHDNGIDGEVEITRSRDGSANHDVTGKRFLVQLKSTDGEISADKPVPARIKAMHVRYWSESNLPVLLTRCHLPTGRFYWRWVDETFLAELTQRDPGWIGRDELTVHLPADSSLGQAALVQIEAFVSKYRRTARRVLAAGAYISLQERTFAVREILATLATEADVAVTVKRLADLRESLTRCTYVIALAGPARAGKSTLMNALLGRAISPVGRLPTTAVPVMVVAGSADEAEIAFHEGPSSKGPATDAFLAEFATQEKNPDNDRRVKLVMVRLVNETLERGIAFADAPGLHDPSEAMRKITDLALDAAHAVVYVLDISPARNGGFSLSEQHIADLKRLRSKAERVFLVLNKADDVSEEDRVAASGYIEQQLRKYGIWSDLPVPPIFLSAKVAWEWDRAGVSPIADLEGAIWTHLLRTQSTGVDRLSGSLVELSRAAKDLSSILAIQDSDAAKASHLKASLSACRERRVELLNECRRYRQEESTKLTSSLWERQLSIRADLEQWLLQTPTNQDLPGVDAIRERLQSHVIATLQSLWADASARAQVFAQHIAGEVERCLQQARAAVGTGGGGDVRFVLPALQGLESLASEPLTEAWTGLIALALVGLLMETPLFWLMAAGGWVLGMVLGEERRRKRQIAKVMKKLDEWIPSSLESVHGQVFEKIALHAGYLESHVLDRIVLLVSDAERRLAVLVYPRTADATAKIAAWQARIAVAAHTIASIAGDLDPSLLPHFAGDPASAP